MGGAVSVSPAWDAIRPRFSRAYFQHGPMVLADKIGASREQVWRWETGVCEPSALAILAIQQGLDALALQVQQTTQANASRSGRTR